MVHDDAGVVAEPIPEDGGLQRHRLDGVDHVERIGRPADLRERLAFVGPDIDEDQRALLAVEGRPEGPPSVALFGVTTRRSRRT